MKIGRKDNNDRPENRPPATGVPNESHSDGGAARPPSASFDWSKVKGSGAQPGEAPSVKREKPKKAARDGEKKKFVWPLSRNETYLAAAIAILFLGIAYFGFLRGDPGLAPSVTAAQIRKMDQDSKKEALDALAEMEKKFGPNHPEVQQQREMLKQLKIEPGK